MRNFRNFSHREISFCEGKNCIIGLNGKGKSNIIEALSLPYRPLHLNDAKICVKENETLYFLGYETNIGKMSLSFDAQQGKKKYIFEGKSTTRKKIIESYPHCVRFYPMEMNLMYLSPGERRNFLDEILLQIFPEYEKILGAYGLVLKQRNALLKSLREGKGNKNSLHFWNEKMIQGSLKIYEYREKIISFYQKNIHILDSYFPEKKVILEFTYVSKTLKKTLSETEIFLREYIKTHEEKEILLGKSLFGPHLDDFDIMLNGKSLSQYASRGEIKSCILGMLLLQIDFITLYSKKEIIFLLDDILAELDLFHRNMLLEKIGNFQAIITSIEDIDFPGEIHKIYL